MSARVELGVSASECHLCARKRGAPGPTARPHRGFFSL